MGLFYSKQKESEAPDEDNKCTKESSINNEKQKSEDCIEKNQDSTPVSEDVEGEDGEDIIRNDNEKEVSAAKTPQFEEGSYSEGYGNDYSLPHCGVDDTEREYNIDTAISDRDTLGDTINISDDDLNNEITVCDTVEERATSRVDIFDEDTYVDVISHDVGGDSPIIDYETMEGAATYDVNNVINRNTLQDTAPNYYATWGNTTYTHFDTLANVPTTGCGTFEGGSSRKRKHDADTPTFDQGDSRYPSYQNIADEDNEHYRENKKKKKKKHRHKNRERDY